MAMLEAAALFLGLDTKGHSKTVTIKHETLSSNILFILKVGIIYTGTPSLLK